MLDKNYENTNDKPQHTNQADNKKTNHSYKGWSSIIEPVDYKSISEKPKCLSSKPRTPQHSLGYKVVFT